MTDERNTREHPIDDLAAYALGALEPAEEASVREHLEDCERCRAELLWLEPAIDVLPAAVPQIEPPRRLKRELMKTVRADVRDERGAWWTRRPGWITMRARPAVVIGAMALLGAGIAGYAVNETNRAGQDTVTSIQADVRPPVDEASAVLERSGDEAVMRVARLPALEGEDVYQLWIKDGAAVEPANAFTVGEDGAAEADVGEIPSGADEVLVTEESEPGRQAPEGKILIRAPLT